MTTSNVQQAHAPATVLSGTKAALWLSLTAFLALMALYFIGVDQGATSILGGDNMYIHEFMHDARHLLGFPCH